MNKEPLANEKPLRGSARWALIGGAGATILLSYLFSIAAVLGLLVLLGAEFLLLLVLARFGAARLMAPAVGAHVALLLVLLRSFWLRKGVDFRIQLPPADAPELFAIIERLCRRAGVAMPREVSVEMNVNAWVRLKGYRRGAGRTILGIGYDLLAGLSQWEIEGVLAHEIMHAKFVQRGLNHWLNRGLGRISKLARGLAAHADAHRRANQFMQPGPLFLHAADTLTRLAARLVAGCLRQDEFEADLGAAELCGAGAIRSALRKLDALGQCAARLPWPERVARLQTGEGFSHWLVAELASADFKGNEESAGRKQNLFFQYSTHPSLADRLAALPPDDAAPPADSPPGIRLLSDPDKVAETLMSEIQKIAAAQEREDTKRLRRWSRKRGIRARLRPAQFFGVALMLAGVGGWFFGWLADVFNLPFAAFFLFFVAAGAVSFRLGRYRDRLALPVPHYAMLKAAWQNKPKFTPEQVAEMEKELTARADRAAGRGGKELALAAAAYEALGRCDYVRAHVAARLCLKVNSKSIEGVCALAVGAAGLGQVQQVHNALNYLQNATAMTGVSTQWAAGWALLLCGDWAPAEAFLERRAQVKPKLPAILLLLALCQSSRGKLQSALLLAREVCTPVAEHPEYAKALIDLLLRAGYLHEAQARLKPLAAEIAKDDELTMLAIRLNLLLRDFAAAEKWTAQLKEKPLEPHWFVRLGQVHEIARQHAKAAEFYREALGRGFFPESLLGLARIETLGRNKDQAREHLLAALNTKRDLGAKATGPLLLFHDILRALLSLDDPVPNCRAWIATLNGQAPPGLGNKSLLIYASTRRQAEEFLARLFSAMQPGTPFEPANVGWREAQTEKQPDVPVRAGVQGVM